MKRKASQRIDTSEKYITDYIKSGKDLDAKIVFFVFIMEKLLLDIVSLRRVFRH